MRSHYIHDLVIVVIVLIQMRGDFKKKPQIDVRDRTSHSVYHVSEKSFELATHYIMCCLFTFVSSGHVWYYRSYCSRAACWVLNKVSFFEFSILVIYLLLTYATLFLDDPDNGRFSVFFQFHPVGNHPVDSDELVLSLSNVSTLKIRYSTGLNYVLSWVGAAIISR